MLEKVTKQRDRKNPNHDDSLATALLLHSSHLKIFIYIFILEKQIFILSSNISTFCYLQSNAFLIIFSKISDMLPFLQAQSNADSFIEAGRRHKTTSYRQRITDYPQQHQKLGIIIFLCQFLRSSHPLQVLR